MEDKTEYLESALRDQIKINEDLQEAIANIGRRQSRERQENLVLFAVEVDGELRHESKTYEAAFQAAQFYDEARVVTWTSTPVRYVNPSEEKDEGN